MKIGFYSCLAGSPWGGSELLWSGAAQRLLAGGCNVAINVKRWDRRAETVEGLSQQGAHLTERVEDSTSWLSKLRAPVERILAGTAESQWLMSQSPELVVVTMSYQLDPITICLACQKQSIPYVVNLQAVNPAAFYHSGSLEMYRRAFAGAKRVYVVSQKNVQSLERNLGMQLANVEQVTNPFDVAWESDPNWPEFAGYRLACLARIHFAAKGQDLLVEVLKQQKWRERDLSIGIVGPDHGNERQLRDLVRHARLEDRFVFEGHQPDVQAVWSRYQGLILPSRYEGAACVVPEAMLCNRFVICTDTGRNRELIEPGKSGFIASAHSAQALDEAIEDAWTVRDQWREMGQFAGHSIREQFPTDPVGDFARQLQELQLHAPSVAQDDTVQDSTSRSSVH